MSTAAPLQALIKQCPQDWRVNEDLGFTPSGSGEHVCFHVEKTGLDTVEVAHALADALKLRRVDVGFAGRKDRHGVTRQWFSVHSPDAAWPLQMPGVQCLDQARHTRKLRPGAHRGNFFELLVRPVPAGGDSGGNSSGNVQTLARSLERARNGFSNIFGPQRVNDSNVEQALRWLGQDTRRRGRQRGGKRGWHLSVLRSYLFNAVVTCREAHVAPGRFCDGDLLVDGQPSAPMWGRGRSSTRGEALALEQQALAPHAETCAALEFTGLKQDRRAMFVKPRGLSVAVEPEGCRMTFWLPPGAYATGLLAAQLDYVDASRSARPDDEI